jgi:hypothetical protein
LSAGRVSGQPSYSNERTASSSSLPSIDAADQASNETESWFTDYGGFSDLNEDVWRSINAEVKDMDSTIHQIQVAIKQEDSTANQLNKDNSHAESEMQSFKVCSNELVDSASMHDRIRVDLEKTLKVDLVEPLSEHHSKNYTNGGGDDDETGNSNKENRITTIKKFLQQSYQEADPILRGGDNKTLAKSKADCSVLQQEIGSIGQRIHTENLHSLLDQKTKESTARSHDLAAEESRKQTIQEAIKQYRIRCGNFAQDIADQVGLVHVSTIFISLSPSVLIPCVRFYSWIIISAKELCGK